MYWAIVTVTTVGFGDISPQTIFGQLLASLLMLIGYSIIAVPTGIVSSGILNPKKIGSEEDENVFNASKSCSRCQSHANTVEDNYCWKCGAALN